MRQTDGREENTRQIFLLYEEAEGKGEAARKQTNQTKRQRTNNQAATFPGGDEHRRLNEDARQTRGVILE